jgi:tRNA-splicing endonuclease subunit Sen15, fungi type
MATTSTAQSPSLPAPSALTSFIDSTSIKLPTNALPLEVLHNLRYQHNWTELHVHPSQSSPSDSNALPKHSQNDTVDPLSHSIPPEPLHPPPVPLLSGVPPRPIYTHPDFQAHLLAHSLTDTDIPVQREWVLPLNIGEKWTLERFCAVFDALPARAPLQGVDAHRHRDNKRLLLAMLSHQGKGGDGTIVYYIMQEGDVKPRQN